MIAPGEPFLRPPRKRWTPPEMINAPRLDSRDPGTPIESRYALLVNPFYPKDANASFGKHVLTPTLALSSFAATTPDPWRVEYWDENLLDGRPPFSPMPEVVGITVHLTFARRAFELADWYRKRGCESDSWRTARPLLSGGMRAACRCAGLGRWRSTLAADPHATLKPTGCGPATAPATKAIIGRPGASPVHPSAPWFPHYHQPDRYPRMP